MLSVKNMHDKTLKNLVHTLRKNVKNFWRPKLVSLQTSQKINGKVLLSYCIEPFLLKPSQATPNYHTNQWECLQIAKTFLNFGYSVDIINWNDREFIPKQDYSFLIDIHSNLERLTPLLNSNCVKILHITGANWLFQNQAEYKRLSALQQRRNISLMPRRIAPFSLGIEYADYATILGNQFTINTFAYAKKPIYQIPLSTTVTYPWPEDKDYNSCRNRFLWFGSSGMVHKGLDLVLEAFREMPEYHLTVCGPVTNEQDFVQAFYQELYLTPNIQTIGWCDISSPQFLEITKNCIALIYPSCSEGQAGSVVTCMHSGLIPIVSYESGVDVNDFGLVLKNCSIAEIKDYIKKIANLPDRELKQRSKQAWEFARNNHTREKFAAAYQDFVINLLDREKNR